ncbi:MAG: peptide chain release factor N(5)-glutamine methyltransferase [Candidatus Omnitrophica bacterium]|nr:peptide chain release factor N(5)-glutamine methyltransferase [Candidatus Omnitrophota bacterium]
MTENEWMLTSVLDCRRVDLAVNKGELTPFQRSRYDQMRFRRAQGEPLQYIIGQCDFMGIPLSVDRRALIPRPETEILVDLTIEKIRAMPKKALNVLDLGVGSGNITVALLRYFTEMNVTAIDISDDALALAVKNATANNVEQRIEFLNNDMVLYMKEAIRQGEKFDVIVSNPPYIPTGQLAQLPDDVRREPRLALDGGDDGLRFYRSIIEYGWQFLTANGFLVMEIGDGQREGIEKIFAQYPQYGEIKFYKDYVGTQRIVFARLGGSWKN